MFTTEYAYKTIKESYNDLLEIVINEGKKVENTLEVANVSICITKPLLLSENLLELLTQIAEKHYSQMMIEPDQNLEKTHHSRIHNFLIGKSNEMGEDVVSYDQIEEVIKKMKENPFSKRAVITLWQPQDINDKYAFSYVLSQLLIRDEKLIITNYFRSCDIWNGFPFNCLGIANLHNKIANRLGVKTGEFIVHIGSAHIYRVNEDKIKEYLAKV